MPKTFNDFLACLLLLVVIPSLWILSGLKIVDIDGVILGATISTFTLIVQFYFRKKQGGV